jgi:hypothetical protein
MQSLTSNGGGASGDGRGLMGAAASVCQPRPIRQGIDAGIFHGVKTKGCGIIFLLQKVAELTALKNYGSKTRQ